METAVFLLVVLFLFVSPFVLAQGPPQGELPPLTPREEGGAAPGASPSPPAPGGLFPGFGGQGQQGVSR